MGLGKYKKKVMLDREQEILNDPWAGKTYCDIPREYIDPAFLDGVFWADEHPESPWRNINVDLPEVIDGYSDQVLLRLESDRYVLSYLDSSITWTEENRRWNGLNRLEQSLVTHWCPIPKFNK